MIDFSSGKHNPKTLDEAVDTIYQNLNSEDRAKIKGEVDGRKFHRDWGEDIRNDWGLNSGGDLADHFKNVYGLGHPDDMSALILDSIVNKVNGEPFSVDDEVKAYKEYWGEQGVDPLILDGTDGLVPTCVDLP